MVFPRIILKKVEFIILKKCGFLVTLEKWRYVVIPGTYWEQKMEL